MDKRTIINTKNELKPFIEILEREDKGLYSAVVKPLLGNDNTSPFILEVQANWIDNMDCLDAISYLFEKLNEAETPIKIMKSIFAIQVIGMDKDIKCQELNYAVKEDELCYA